jgi:cephalosporin hydroxylase
MGVHGAGRPAAQLGGHPLVGAPALKCPLDLWTYQEIVHELTPDLIIETGTAAAGGGLLLAMLCEAKGRGEVISIDIRKLR